jgi:AdoMet-dependent heme synthase
MATGFDFEQSPLVVIWETSQACDLACRHCRASASPLRDGQELTTEEAFDLLAQVRCFGNPLMVFTGGDPMKRPDLFELLERSASLGLRTNVSPSATPLLTPKTVRQFQRSGVARMAISVDGWDEASHDAFRGVPGTFAQGLRALEEARRIGLETQIGTTVTRHNRDHLMDIAQLVNQVGAKMWSAFFLVVTGRAQASDDLTPEEYEEVFGVLYEVSRRYAFDVKTTEAMHYRRYVAQRRKREGRAAEGQGTAVVWRTQGVSDARGFVFISHTGEIYPSGFLALSAGNVRTDSLLEVYRKSGLFRVLRDMDARGGKCGVCEYRNLCGGSRARAYAHTGDYLAEEPNCAYEPRSCVVGVCS